MSIIPRTHRGRAVLAAVTGIPFLLVCIQSTAYGLQADEGSTKLTLFSAVVLGLVEGLTEYLPVSSTGHLLITNKLLGLGGTEASDSALETYAIAIQIGAIAAVLVLYQARIRQMLDGLLGRSEDGRKVLLAVLGAFIPTAIIGLVLRGPVRDNLFGVPPIAGAWIVGGIAILVLTRSGVMKQTGTELINISLQQAVLIGLAQSLALWPGTSRSLITIIAALVVGMSLAAAVEFSFLLGLITLSAATALSILDGGDELIDQFGYLNPAVGMIVAFISALASIKWMVSWLQEKNLDVFGYYRIAIGIAAFLLLGFTNVL